MAGRFFAAVVEQARSAGLMSDGPFTVDDTLIDAWASMKSFQRKDTGKQKPPDDPGNPTVNSRGEKRSNRPRWLCSRTMSRHQRPWLATAATTCAGLRTQLAAHLNGAAYNLLRIAKLTAAPT